MIYFLSYQKKKKNKSLSINYWSGLFKSVTPARSWSDVSSWASTEEEEGRVCSRATGSRSSPIKFGDSLSIRPDCFLGAKQPSRQLMIPRKHGHSDWACPQQRAESMRGFNAKYSNNTRWSHYSLNLMASIRSFLKETNSFLTWIVVVQEIVFFFCFFLDCSDFATRVCSVQSLSSLSETLHFTDCIWKHPPELCRDCQTDLLKSMWSFPS